MGFFSAIRCAVADNDISDGLAPTRTGHAMCGQRTADHGRGGGTGAGGAAGQSTQRRLTRHIENPSESITHSQTRYSSGFFLNGGKWQEMGLEKWKWQTRNWKWRLKWSMLLSISTTIFLHCICIKLSAHSECLAKKSPLLKRWVFSPVICTVVSNDTSNPHFVGIYSHCVA